MIVRRCAGLSQIKEFASAYLTVHRAIKSGKRSETHTYPGTRHCTDGSPEMGFAQG